MDRHYVKEQFYKNSEAEIR